MNTVNPQTAHNPAAPDFDITSQKFEKFQGRPGSDARTEADNLTTHLDSMSTEIEDISQHDSISSFDPSADAKDRNVREINTYLATSISQYRDLQDNAQKVGSSLKAKAFLGEELTASERTDTVGLAERFETETEQFKGVINKAMNAAMQGMDSQGDANAAKKDLEQTKLLLKSASTMFSTIADGGPTPLGVAQGTTDSFLDNATPGAADPDEIDSFAANVEDNPLNLGLLSQGLEQTGLGEQVPLIENASEEIAGHAEAAAQQAGALGVFSELMEKGAGNPVRRGGSKRDPLGDIVSYPNLSQARDELKELGYGAKVNAEGGYLEVWNRKKGDSQHFAGLTQWGGGGPGGDSITFSAEDGFSSNLYRKGQEESMSAPPAEENNVISEDEVEAFLGYAASLFPSDPEPESRPETETTEREQSRNSGSSLPPATEPFGTAPSEGGPRGRAAGA